MSTVTSDLGAGFAHFRDYALHPRNDEGPWPPGVQWPNKGGRCACGAYYAYTDAHWHSEGICHTPERCS